MPSGTNYNRISGCLESRAYRRAFLNGGLAVEEYIEYLLAERENLSAQGFTLDDLHLTCRTPLDEEAFVASALRDLQKSGMIESVDYSVDKFEELRAQVLLRFDHLDFQTYIFPEEERLAYSISSIACPRSICVLGAYYGYWTIWLEPLHSVGASIVLIDPNPTVLALAESNFRAMSISSARFVCADAAQYLSEVPDQYDLFLLDAEGPINHPDPEYRGKAIYGPLVRAATPRARAGAMLMAHNIIISATDGSDYFRQKSERNRAILSPFLDVIDSSWVGLVEIGTTEGIGVARRRGR
jgi:predicted O-methyltransferase YrrM